MPAIKCNFSQLLFALSSSAFALPFDTHISTPLVVSPLFSSILECMSLAMFSGHHYFEGQSKCILLDLLQPKAHNVFITYYDAAVAAVRSQIKTKCLHLPNSCEEWDLSFSSRNNNSEPINRLTSLDSNTCECVCVWWATSKKKEKRYKMLRRKRRKNDSSPNKISHKILREIQTTDHKAHTHIKCIWKTVHIGSQMLFLFYFHLSQHLSARFLFLLSCEHKRSHGCCSPVYKIGLDGWATWNLLKNIFTP